MSVTEVGTPNAPAVSSATNTPSAAPTWAASQPRTAGNFLVCSVTNWGGTTGGTPPTPSGWSQLLTITGSARSVVTFFGKYAAGGDAAPTITATNTGTATFSTLTAQLHELTGMDTTTAVGASGTATGTTANPLVIATSGNVPAADCYALSAASVAISAQGTSTLGAGSGWTDVADNGSTSTRAHWLYGSQASPASGSTLSESVSYTGTGAFLAGAIIVIQPPSSVAGAASLSGTGTLTAAASQPATASLSGTGTLTAAGTTPPSASLSGSGLLTATAALGLRGAAAVTTGGGSATLNVPAQQCAIGDEILIWAAVAFPAITFTSAGGDGLSAEAANSPASTPQMSTQLFRRIATSADVAKAAASGSYTITASASHPWSAIIAVVPVTDTAHPLDPSDTPGSGQSNAASTSATAAGITTTGPGRLLVWLGADRNTAGASPPAMTPPAGYTVPAGVTQANSAGSATGNVGVLIAQQAQYIPGATGSVAGTYTGSQVSAGLLLAVKAAPVVPLPGVVNQLAAGAPTASSIQVVAKITGGTSVRLAYSTASNMASPSYLTAQTPDSSSYVRYTVPALAAHTRYYVQLADTPSGGTEQLVGPVGACKTLPAAGSAQSFTVALVSCIAEGDTTTPPALDAAMADWVTYDADLNIFTGDLDYSGNTSTVTADHVATYETQVGRYAQLAAMVSTRWGFYCRSDHEAGPDNGDSNNTYTAANLAAAQQCFPFGTLGDTVNTPVHGLYQTWVAGRVRFIMLDIRNTDRSPGGNTDDASKTMLGATQLAWLQAQLIQPEPLKVIICDVAWMGPASIINGPDKWWSYDTERQAILAYIAAHAAQVQSLMLWHGDSHLVGATPGPANAYGGFPVYCAAPMLNTGGGLNTGTFSSFYNNAGGECRLYGRISITDDGAKITVQFQGWDAAAGVARVTQTDIFQTAAALSGTGTLTAAGRITGAASLAGTGTLTAAATERPAAALAGAGALNAAATTQPAASLAGTGTLTAAATARPGAALAGAGAVQAAAGVNPAAALSGTGSLAASSSGAVPGAATLTGTGTLTAAGMQRAAAALSGAGVLTAAAAAGAVAALNGSGLLTAPAAAGAAASLSGSGLLTAPATQRAAAALAGGGTLTAASSGGTSGTASLAGAGVLTAGGANTGAAVLSGAGALAAAAAARAAAPLAGLGVLTAGAVLTVRGAAYLTGTGQLAATVLVVPLNPVSGVRAGAAYTQWTAGEPLGSYSAGSPYTQWPGE